MSDFTLKSKREAIPLISAMFGGDNKARLQISEDSCFAEKWIDIGTISLFPSTDDMGDPELIEQAIDLGFYEWSVREFKEIVDEIAAMIEVPKGAKEKEKDKEVEKVRAAVKAISHVAIRCGFTHPSFDAGSTIDMPFRRPVTIVTDTSAVLHGGLDFVVRFLYPMARIKIPAIAQMEILNNADNFLKLRREGKKKVGSTLLEHTKSQGGQRVLLRLELQTDAEIERPRVGADPLKGFVSPSTDSEDKNLGLSYVQRSYADRLILETALQHRERLPADHQIMLLTSDQGLARMTLSEGLQPLFFSSPDPDIFFGRSYSGTAFLPFPSQVVSQKIYSISLPELLWELAVTFGSARLVREGVSEAFVVCAMGKKLSWQPFHSKDDLLWVQTEHPVVTAPPESAAKPLAETADKPVAEQAGKPMIEPEVKPVAEAADNPVAEPVDKPVAEPVDKPVAEQAGKPMIEPEVKPVAEAADNPVAELVDMPAGRPVAESTVKAGKPGKPLVAQEAKSLKGAYQFSLDLMLTIIQKLITHYQLSDKNGIMMLNLSSSKRYFEYKHFLVAGGLAEKTESGLQKNQALEELWSALIGLRHDDIKNSLRRVPSFDRFMSELKQGVPVTEKTVSSISKYAFGTYAVLAEICCGAINIPNEGIFATPSSPSPKEFTENALDAFKILKPPTDEYVLTGKWLEYLAINYGVHPLKAKERLNEARQAGFLERYTEGSTPETQYDKHKIYVIGIEKNVPRLYKIHLYQGTFLIPDRTSVMLRLEEKN